MVLSRQKHLSFHLSFSFIGSPFVCHVQNLLVFMVQNAFELPVELLAERLNGKLKQAKLLVINMQKELSLDLNLDCI